MIKRLTILLIVLFVVLPPLSISAQSTVTQIDTIAVEIWPDYDDTAVLVLLTGFLPPNTTYPATLTITLPENADINAVAHITEENLLTDQGIEYSIEGNELTFTTPSPGFRIEFYMPYTANGLDRDLSYTWQSETAVNNMNVIVQQPMAASKLSTTPNAANTTTGNDGLTYHNLPTQSLTAGEPFTVAAAYTMNTPSLTAELRNNTNTAVNTQNTPAPAPTSDNINWPLLLAGIGVVLILLAIVWQLAIRQKNSRKPRKPQKQQTTSATKAKYCHHCGLPLQPKDKFCRDCGTAVKK